MLSSVFRSILFDNQQKVYSHIKPISVLIDSMVGSPEKDINPAIAQKITKSLNNLSLGSTNFKNHYYIATIATEAVVSHQKYCNMNLPPPYPKKKSELGDIVIAVDYVLEDLQTKTKKIINGAASVIETKKEKSYNNGLTAAQLYLMTQWPPFGFRSNLDWKLNVFPDNFGFYLIILDETLPKSECSRVLSAPMITHLSRIDKSQLLSKIDGTVSVQPDLLKLDACGKSILMPLTFGTYLYHALLLLFGSPSMNFRALLKQKFFPKMEETEDCDPDANMEEMINETPNLLALEGNSNPNPADSPFENEKDNRLFAIRIKMILTKKEG